MTKNSARCSPVWEESEKQSSADSKYGSRVLIGEIVTSVVFPKTESELPNPCIDCFLCVKNCPTDALKNGFNKKSACPYLSQKTSADYELYDKMELAVGCDVCQDVCPLNRKEYDYRRFRFDRNRFVLQDFLEISETSRNTIRTRLSLFWDTERF